MNTKAGFRTKARAIDHLGRGQIADAPTAVSELWKNAYDAYARKVELHIFEGKECVAAIIDNGCGMNSDDLHENWLVIGTENKVTSRSNKTSLFNLPFRKAQGEKGIGRLSAAFLSPLTLVISKKIGSPFTAVLVDWRFFENPFLLISDIEFPIVEFSDIKEIIDLFPEMHSSIKEELDFSQNNNKSKHVHKAWDEFDLLEKEQRHEKTTRERILDLDSENLIKWDHLYPWWTILREAPEKEHHGTALFAIQANTELSSSVQGEYEGEDVKEVNDDLKQTLISFIDPYSPRETDFDYSVTVHKVNFPAHIVLDSNENFNIEELKALEHYIDGEFDANGIFRGQVKAFGIERSTTEVRPAGHYNRRGRDHLGPFKFCIGTFEQTKNSSTHSAEEFENLINKAEIYGGICIYRDGLRVMPYGRVGADIFDLEVSRSKHAGRYFFSYRRSFGRVAFTSSDNPNLKDKSGREGLVDNTARRQLERLVKNLLVELAKTYYGTDSTIRESELPSIKKRNAALQKAAESARKRNTKDFKKALKTALPRVIAANKSVHEYVARFNIAIDNRDTNSLLKIKHGINTLDLQKDELKLPNRPAILGNVEDDYKSFRDIYVDFSVNLENLKMNIAKCEAEGMLGNPKEIAIRKFHQNESRLSRQIDKYLNSITNKIDTLKTNWSEIAREDRKSYHKISLVVSESLQQQQQLDQVLNMIDREYTELKDNFDLKYTGISNSLDQLLEGVDIGAAFLYSDLQNVRLEEKVEQLNAVAQLGISVEIIGHELESLETQVTSYLRKMPSSARALTSYKLAYEAHRALVDRLRFLTPLKKSTYRTRTEITGTDITKYLKGFFNDTFERYRINFIATESFLKIKIRDLQSRIYPVFINLVNNSLYWVQYGKERKICLDFHDGKVIVSDSGNGVAIDDREKLFELFFTKRINGRGIGLYLCRQNLAVAHHRIRYADDGDPTVLCGANFIIEFNGVENV